MSTWSINEADLPADGELVAAAVSASPPPISVTSPSRPLVLRRGSRAHRVLLLVGALALALLIVVGANLGAFDQGQVTRLMIYAIAIAGLNISTGYTGMVSVGHSAFLGLGAYTTGVLVVKYGWAPVYTLPAALVVCFAVGVVVGLPALRIRGLYLAMATLAFGVAFPELVARFASLTGGPQGLNIPRRLLTPPAWSGFTLSEKGQWLYWLSLVVLLLVMVVVHNLVRGRYGLAMIAARDNEIAAAASGVNLALVKTMAFGVSGALTGVGGALFAMYLGNLFAEGSFTLLNAIALLTGLVIGGQATRFGPVVGAIAVVYIPYYTSSIGQGQAAAVLFGAVLIAIVFLAPEGVVGAVSRLLRKAVVLTPAIPRPLDPDHIILSRPPEGAGPGRIRQQPTKEGSA